MNIIDSALYASALGFNIVQEKQPKADLTRPRELRFEAYPSVRNTERGVTISYYAPAAQQVALCLMDDPAEHPMKPAQAKGYWSVTFEGLLPGMYFYSLLVNGVKTLDCAAPIVFASRAANYFEVLEEGFDDYLMKDVPHGAVQMRYFHSKESDSMRSVLVYTPPEYDAGNQRYPVLYMQHGGGENEGGWLWSGRINHIMDNLIASKRCKPMLVVMNDGQVLNEESDGWRSTGSVTEMFRRDAVPFIDGAFRTIPDRTHRAVAGLSQGGLQARCIAFENTDLFGYLGVFSSGAGFEVDSTDIWGERHDYTSVFASPEHYASLFRETLVTCGLDDPRCVYNRAQVEALQAKGFHVRFQAYPGAHVWQVWRKSVCDFLPLIFRD